ncbi:MAG: MFS transporter [Betaproteobacteria bacterium]|nr:MFS transporter [Betaproteobacteria bacterium]
MSRTSPQRTLTTCCAMHTLHDGLSDVSYVLLPILAQAFNLSLAQVGIIRSAHRASMALFQTPAGLIAERLGARNLLAFGTGCAGLAFIALGQSAGFAAILLALFCAGFGSAFQHPLCSTLISHAYPGDGRRAALGTYNFFGDVGKFAFGGAVSLLFVAGVPWQLPVTVFGSLALAGALSILLLLHETAGRGSQHAAAPSGGGRTRAGWGIRNRQGFTALCLIEIIDGSTRTGFLTFVAFLMIAKNLPAGWAALSVPLILIGGMAGKLACGFLAERIGIIRTVVITEVATGIGILLMLVLPDVAAYLLLPLIGVALNGTSSVLYATIGDLVEPHRLPRVFGLFYTINSVCGLIVPIAFGLIGDAFGVTTSIALIGMLAFATLPLCLMLKPALRAANV